MRPSGIRPFAHLGRHAADIGAFWAPPGSRPKPMRNPPGSGTSQRRAPAAVGRAPANRSPGGGSEGPGQADRQARRHPANDDRPGQRSAQPAPFAYSRLIIYDENYRLPPTYWPVSTSRTAASLPSICAKAIAGRTAAPSPPRISATIGRISLAFSSSARWAAAGPPGQWHATAGRNPRPNEIR